MHASPIAVPTREDLLDAYRKMRTIRAFEEELHHLVMAGQLTGFLHLCSGQEAVAVGVVSQLDARDSLASTHRGHGHCIARGVDPNAMMAEIHGRATGVCRGKGGSLHIADLSLGMLGANGIVGAGIPIAVGAALTCRYRRTGGVAVAFFGDGAANQGAFHEAANLAALWQLPVLFVCENNGYGEATPAEFATSVRDVAERASAYGMPGVIADGMDFFDVREKAAQAIAGARRGEGPTLLECKTYRYHGHYVGDTKAYRPAAEEEAMRRERDPLDRFERSVVSRGWLDAVALRAVDAEVALRIRDAVAFARSSPEPEPEELHRDVYGEYGA